jgi:hypothetical protein
VGDDLTEGAERPQATKFLDIKSELLFPDQIRVAFQHDKNGHSLEAALRRKKIARPFMGGTLAIEGQVRARTTETPDGQPELQSRQTSRAQ